MTVTYTTVALLKKRCKYISNDLTDTADGDIENNIVQVESIIDSVMRQTARGAAADFAFDAAKHGIIRNVATDYAAYLCIKYDPSEFPTMETAEFEINALWNDIKNGLEILSDPRTVQYLKGIA